MPPAVGHARSTSRLSPGPPIAAVPPNPPAPSALSSQLPAPALAVLETGGHSPITYRLSVTRVCPPLGLVSKKSITSCHAPEPLPQLLDTPVYTYLKTHEDHIHYEHFQAAGLPIG